MMTRRNDEIVSGERARGRHIAAEVTHN